MKIAVLDADTLGRDLNLSPLEKFGELKVFPASAPQEIASHLGEAEVAIVNKLKMNRNTLADVQNLKLICVFATGYDNVDLAFCRERGIAVCNVVGYSTDSVAQLTVAMALSLYTHLREFSTYTANGSYTKGGVANCLTPVYREIAGKTWGIAGYGNIGQAVGRVAKALGCRVIYYKKHPTGDPAQVDIETLCKESDILSVHLPLNEETKGLFNAKRIAQMKPSALFINLARGAVTDEAALANAVANKKLGGLGCDVYAVEPFPADHPFFAIRTLPNVCLTPHMAWGALEARERCLAEICENITVFLAGGRRCRVD